MEFLYGQAITNRIRGLIATGGPVKAAVAYWGAGASGGLGIVPGTDLTIVCDLLSGACNPAEIASLRETLGNERVLTLDNLHAKVWIGEGEVIVGSSNASSNGLCLGEMEQNRNFEGNGYSRDQAAVEAANLWWNQVILQNARTIADEDLTVAQDLFNARRQARPLRALGNTLLTALQTNPNAFVDRNFRVWIWQVQDGAEWADAALAEIQQERPDPGLSYWQDVDNPPPAGSHIMEFNAAGNPPTLDGIWQIIEPSTLVTERGTLLLCREVGQFHDLPLGNLQAWSHAAAAALQEAQNNGEAEVDLDITEFARHLPHAPGAGP